MLREVKKRERFEKREQVGRLGRKTGCEEMIVLSVGTS